MTVRAAPPVSCSRQHVGRDLSFEDSSTQFAVAIVPRGSSCVVHVRGELDLATRNRLFVACTAGKHPATIVDLSRVTFMDCSGYGGLVECRLAIESDGRSFTIRGAAGQPAHLIALIETLESA